MRGLAILSLTRWLDRSQVDSCYVGIWSSGKTYEGEIYILYIQGSFFVVDILFLYLGHRLEKSPRLWRGVGKGSGGRGVQQSDSEVGEKQECVACRGTTNCPVLLTDNCDDRSGDIHTAPRAGVQTVVSDVLLQPGLGAEGGGRQGRLAPSIPLLAQEELEDEGHGVAQHPWSYSAGTRPHVRETNTEESLHTFLSGRALQGICSVPWEQNRTPENRRRVRLGQHTMNFVDDFLKSDRVYCSAVKWHTKSSLQLKKVLYDSKKKVTAHIHLNNKS